MAKTLPDAINAWQIVYWSYVTHGLISPNPYQIHAMPNVISNDTVVIRGRIDDLTISTVSAYLDGPAGLPLDDVYHHELSQLRARGRKLVEIGLLADRYQYPLRAVDAILKLMGHAMYFGIHQGATDGVVGVNAHHVKYYTRLLGFDVIGPEKKYAAVNNNSVVLLRIDWYAKTAMRRQPRGMAYLTSPPTPPEVFDGRFDLCHTSISDTLLERYLNAQQAERADG